MGGGAVAYRDKLSEEDAEVYVAWLQVHVLNIVVSLSPLH